MMDITLAFNQELFEFDLVLEGAPSKQDLQGDEGLYTAITISLFTDRLAHADDPLPDARVGVPSDRRGWWGDCILDADKADPMGSRLWLLWREKELAVVVARAEEYAKEATQWLMRNGHVQSLSVKAYHVSSGYLGIDVQALQSNGVSEVTREYNYLYDYINAGPVKIEAPSL